MDTVFKDDFTVYSPLVHFLHVLGLSGQWTVCCLYVCIISRILADSQQKFLLLSRSAFPPHPPPLPQPPGIVLARCI
jgi:hypothetical protein